jgi:hypothetical protein
MADLSDIIGGKIREFCDKTYYSDIVFSFEQSYDGANWTKEVEFAYFKNGTELWYLNDWNEGQKYIRNLRIWHLEDSEPVVYCKDCKWYREKQGFCVFLVGRGDLSPKDYCSFGEHKDETENGDG